MIPYEELVAALERSVARRASGAPAAAAPRAAAPPATTPRAPAAAAPAAPAPRRPASQPAPAAPSKAGFDEPRDPDMGSLADEHDEDSTHVGSMPGSGGAEHSTEIDIGDVLSDEEL
jgi:hypothetical protein